MHVPGDKYHVHYTVADRTTTDANGPFDRWRDAKRLRDHSFFSFENVCACWITKFNPSQNTKPNLYGNVLKRRVPKKK